MTDHPSTNAKLLAALESVKGYKMTPEEMDAQRESWVRAMAPCEHGVADFEDCQQCRQQTHPIHEVADPQRSLSDDQLSFRERAARAASDTIRSQEAEIARLREDLRVAASVCQSLIDDPHFDDGTMEALGGVVASYHRTLKGTSHD